jgi:crotonobetainyl-CoA:carnitine CoA-transferase CaiB-like acyl-CoA transferase
MSTGPGLTATAQGAAITGSLGYVRAVEQPPEIRALPGVRVLELGHHLGVASAGLALTALGADVAQVRLTDRSMPAVESTYYDRGRRTLDGPTTGSLSELASLADVILTDLADPELLALGVAVDASGLRHGADAQVLVTVRSLGRYGPNRDFRMTDLTEWASTGLANVTRRPHAGDHERYVPVLPPGYQPQALSGLAAAIAVLVGRRWARSSGEPVVADVSVQEVVAAMLHGIFPNYIWNGIVTGNPASPSTSLGMLLPAIDGDIYVRTLDPRQWDALMAWVDDDAVQALGADPDQRLANNDALCLLLGQWASTQHRLALLEEGQRRHIPIALPRSLGDVLAWQQLRARGVWRSVDLDGVAAEVPRLPLLEPPGWAVTTEARADDVAAGWSAP